MISSCSLFGQDIINLRVTSPDGIDWDIDAIKTANDHGPQITENLSGEIVQAFDGVTEATDNDTWTEFGAYGCDSIVNPDEIAGKIAYISRGACSFSDKIWNAEKAGAIGVIVANRAPIDLQTGTHDPGLIIMAGTAPASDSLTIPAIFISYEDRIELEQMMEAGTVMGMFEAAPLYDATGPHSYWTPVDQARPLDLQVVAYRRTSDTLFNVEFNVDITDPNGMTTSFTQMEDTLLPGKDWPTGTIHDPLIQFEDAVYTPTETGLYSMTYSATTMAGDDPIDDMVLTKNFEITDYTFGMDNGVVADQNGMQLNNEAYVQLPNTHDVGAYYRMGPLGATATHASFAIANPAVLLEASGNFEFKVKVYRADTDGDQNADDDLTEAIDSVTYALTGNEVPNQPIFVELNAPLSLDADSLYAIMVESNDGFLFSDKMPVYTTAGGEVYPQKSIAYRFGNTFSSSGYEYWNAGSNDYPHGGRTPIIRLHVEGFEPPVAVEVLPEGTVDVFPTLTNEQVNVKFELHERAEDVYLIVTDVNGRTMYAKEYNNILNETLSLEVNDYPAGNYFLTIQTDRGVRSTKFVVAR